MPFAEAAVVQDGLLWTTAQQEQPQAAFPETETDYTWTAQQVIDAIASAAEDRRILSERLKLDCDNATHA